MFDTSSPHEYGFARSLAVREDKAMDIARQFASTISVDDALTELVGVQEQIARLNALEARLLVRAAGATRVERRVLVEETDENGQPVFDADPREILMVDEVIDEVAAALRRSYGQVHAQLLTARLLNGPLARTLELLDTGAITEGHARVIADQAQRLMTAPLGTDAEADAAFAALSDVLQDRVLPYAVDQTVSKTKHRAARAVVSIDREGAAARRRRARKTCNVWASALDDGLARIEAIMPAVDAASLMATIDERVRACVQDGTVEQLGLSADASLGEIRSAVLARMAIDAAGGRKVEIGVLVDAATLAGLVPGAEGWMRVGSGDIDVARTDLLDLLASPDVDPTFRRLLTDPLSGALVDRGANTYKVSNSLRSWIEQRDRTCTQPGCPRAARRCDIDHATDFADGGRTVIANTHALCRRHHNGKTHGDWRIEDSKPDGSCMFISPTGRHYRHAPVSILPEPPAPPPRKPPPPDDDPPGF